MSAFKASQSTTSLSSSASLCTFPLTGESLCLQAIYLCVTCYGDSGKCMCSACALTCHADHDVRFMAFGRAYCDCGFDGCALSRQSHQVAQEVLTASSQKSIGLDIDGRVEEAAADINLAIDDFAQTTIEFPLDLVAKQSTALVSASKETFWLGADSMIAPRCALEALAAAIFEYHTRGSCYDPTRSGAEWWVQVKDTNDECSLGIDLHYDKDECIAERFEVGIFPQISTVTYLSSSPQFQPTIILSTTANSPVGSAISKTFVSFPSAGKHISFDGRYLHGAPSDPVVNALSAFLGQKSDHNETRITFLVNIWVHHHPSCVLPLDERIIASLPGLDNNESIVINISSKNEKCSCLSVPISSMDVRAAITSKTGQWITLPFVTNDSTWGKSEDETGLVLNAFIPSRDKLMKHAGLSKVPDSFLIHYTHDKCAARLEYEDLDNDEDICKVIESVVVEDSI